MAENKQMKMMEREHKDGSMRFPMVEIEGASSGPILTVTAGVHGSEYNGIDAAVRLIDEVDPKQLSGTLRLVPVANVPGFLARSEAVVPMDDRNLNRVFPGDPDGSYSAALADFLWTTAVEDCDYLIDMHGGDIFEALVPYIGVAQVDDERVTRETLEMGRVYGLPYILEPRGLPGAEDGLSLAAAAREYGIPAILSEVGGEGVLCSDDADTHMRGVVNVMRHLDMLSGEPTVDAPARELETDFWTIEREGLIYPLLELDDSVEEGQRMAVIKDWFGETVQELYAPHDATIIAVVTTLAAREGAVIYQVALDE